MRGKSEPPRRGFGFACDGDPAGARTPDNRLKRQVLYQLSYRVRSISRQAIGNRPLKALNPQKAVFSFLRKRKKEPADVEFSAGPQAGNGTEQVSFDDVAGMAGIEPAMRESKSRALTAWLHPFVKPQGRSRCSGPVAFWGGRRDSNPRHSEPQSDALPTELRPPYQFVTGNWHA